jgi:hypothetical protein
MIDARVVSWRAVLAVTLLGSACGSDDGAGAGEASATETSGSTSTTAADGSTSASTTEATTDASQTSTGDDADADETAQPQACGAQLCAPGLICVREVTEGVGATDTGGSGSSTGGSTGGGSTGGGEPGVQWFCRAAPPGCGGGPATCECAEIVCYNDPCVCEEDGVDQLTCTNDGTCSGSTGSDTGTGTGADTGTGTGA